MDPLQAVIGFSIATIGGTLVLWLVIDKWSWGYIHQKMEIPRKEAVTLSLPLGLLERALYFGAFVLGAYSWIGVWLAIKVAVQWHRWSGERVIYNIFLIGRALSIIMAFIGACVALGGLPKVVE